MLPLAYAVGLAFGPAIGGYAAKPAEQYPDWFDASGFFGRYPYFLPCFIAGALNVLAVVLGIFCLDEVESKGNSLSYLNRSLTSVMSVFLVQTLPSRTPEALKKRAAARIDEGESGTTTTTQDSVQPPSVLALLTKPVLLVLTSFIFMAFENSAWNALVPLYSYTR